MYVGTYISLQQLLCSFLFSALSRYLAARVLRTMNNRLFIGLVLFCVTSYWLITKMCTTAFLAALDRILKLLMKLITIERLTCSPRLNVYEAYYAARISGGASNRICSYCNKSGHEWRRCYLFTWEYFQWGAPDPFVRNCKLKVRLGYKFYFTIALTTKSLFAPWK